jgi:hypothetical protein
MGEIELDILFYLALWVAVGGLAIVAAMTVRILRDW